MTQRYTHPVALERMSHNLCPECGGPPLMHSGDLRFWIPRSCDLTPVGVEERIAQHRASSAAPDQTAASGQEGSA